ncbi:putative RNA-directed DNA polymerase from transposon BS [Lucilia cuprina]|nr:putative RNA-directed DNA polymerase from transposon BS [Lucilia cuprina]
MFIHDEVQMLDTIGAYIESVHSLKTIDNDNYQHVQVPNFFNIFNEIRNNFEYNQVTLTSFSDNKKSDQLERSKLSYGIDNIPNIVLKNIPKIMIYEYCNLFNNMLNNAYFSKTWKMAKVVLLPKKDKDTSNPKNLRAINLLPNIIN